jgi:hypothetical protein
MTGQMEHVVFFGGAAIIGGVGIMYLMKKSKTSTPSGSALQTPNAVVSDPLMPAINTPGFGAGILSGEFGALSMMGGPEETEDSDYGSLGEPVQDWGAPMVLAAPPSVPMNPPVTAAPCPCKDQCNFYGNTKSLTQSAAYQQIMNGMYNVATGTPGGY